MLGFIVFKGSEVFNTCHVGEHLSVSLQHYLELCKFNSELLSTFFVSESTLEAQAVPLRSEWPYDLIQHNNRDLGELCAVPGVALQDLASNCEQ